MSKNSKTKKNALTQLQSSNNTEVLTFNMDDNSKHNLKRIHHVIEQVLNMKVSHAVVIRRALWLYRLLFMEAVYKANTETDTREAMIDRMAEFCGAERQGLIDASEGDFWDTEAD